MAGGGIEQLQVFRIEPQLQRLPLLCRGAIAEPGNHVDAPRVRTWEVGCAGLRGEFLKLLRGHLVGLDIEVCVVLGSERFEHVDVRREGGAAMRLR